MNLLTVALSIATAAFACLQFQLPAALPTLQHSLLLTSGQTAWVLISWLLSATATTPLITRFGDVYGKARTLTWTLTIVAVGCLISALATSHEILLLGRLFQGVGGAVLPLALSLAHEQATADRHTVGRLTIVVPIGGAVGLIAVAPILSWLGWPGLFWLGTALHLIAATLVATCARSDSNGTGGQINWLSAGLLALTCVPLLLSITEASAWGWGSFLQLAVLGTSLGFGLFWTLLEAQSRHPIIDFRLLRRSAVWIGGLLALLHGALAFGVWTLLPLIPQSNFASPAGLTHSLLLMLGATAIAGSVASHHLAGWSPKRQLVLAALASLAGGILFLCAPASWFLLAGPAFFGVGQGIAVVTLQMLVLSASPGHQAGSAAGFLSVSRTLGGTMGAALVTALGTTGNQVSLDLRQGFMVCAGLACAAAWIPLLLRPNHGVK
ncbi:MFS transporter [Lacibacterium aquatile]|uniref:MFS transporter n=1 Tax=Lacibacterium aquatile TaxID=1168082 RepID=A0ABW5E1R0_9PROT